MTIERIDKRATAEILGQVMFFGGTFFGVATVAWGLSHGYRVAPYEPVWWVAMSGLTTEFLGGAIWVAFARRAPR